MWNDILKMLMLAQTEQEKRMTYFGLIFVGFFFFLLVLDSLAKGKLIRKKGPLKKIIIFLTIIIAIAVISLQFIYK